MDCPVHGPMAASDTRYGVRWSCAAPDCTVACWGGDTSTPAGDHTRSLRHKCHMLFDPLWKNKTRFQSRGQAYKWLARLIGTDGAAHIGQFNAAQCNQLLIVLDGQTARRHGFDRSSSFDLGDPT